MSMFLDQVKVNVKAGNGGDGMVAFRREKYVPDGGPAGGDGGEGGDIVFIVDEGLRTLMDFRYNRHFKASHGENGMSKGMHGRGAKDLFVKVPPGTVVKDAETGTLYADLTDHNQKAIIAKGGRGGRGNIRFASPKNPAPEIAENGEPGEDKEIELELKVLADVGLIGFPSVGKSTLLSVVSAARPKIGAYHFTTLVPNLGMVNTEENQSFVLADMPGLIEGASQGVGLGIEFLRHIERTRVLLHVIDMSGVEGRDPIEDYYTINQELKEYDLKLRERPQLIIANKMDMPDSQDNLSAFKAELKKNNEDVEIFEVSALTQTGLNAVMSRTAELLQTAPEFPLYEEETEKEERVLYKFQPENKEFTITRDPDGTWEITGDKVQKLYKMTNFQFDESVMRFSRQLRGMGIDKALRDRGAQDGDTVRIDDFEFDFVE
ncbi:MAG: GTPase ObgE [Alkalibacterium gilvum]|uniref:GTPase Obg n=1 Tax=Alkalibacterium gilvum TaxID=1130080 RepID=A0A1H6R2L3_9LACT|nr:MULTISPECIES: GTPase ObgE [Alkalibacterium]SEI48666.1 GTP-binding protein [Alkalibacterium gilvum]